MSALFCLMISTLFRSAFINTFILCINFFLLYFITWWFFRGWTCNKLWICSLWYSIDCWKTTTRRWWLHLTFGYYHNNFYIYHLKPYFRCSSSLTLSICMQKLNLLFIHRIFSYINTICSFRYTLVLLKEKNDRDKRRR